MAIAARYPREEPRQKLPVAAHPALPASRMVEIRDRETFKYDDVAGQPRPSVQPLDQIVAEHTVFRDSAFQAALEGSHIVDALTYEDAAAEQILIDVRHGPR